jgi:FkbM family methyltransferase
MSATDQRIVAHHVGGRGFGVALNAPERLSKDLVHVLYEADEVCARAMMAENKADNYYVLPYCLGKENSDGRIFITKNPYASSNFEPDPAYYPYYCEVHLSGEVEGVMLNNAVYDVVYGNDFSVAETRDVRIRALDDIIARKEAPAGLVPDFLSLDTQGSELNILAGGERTFHNHCLALATEIEFHPMYKNQALFAEIFNFALKHGFHFVGFTYLQEISPRRLPLGARAKGVLAFGDALFFRNIESVRSIATSPNDLYVKLMKLAFISMNFGYLEYAVQVLEAAAQANPDADLRDRLLKRDCFKFLAELQDAVARLPTDLPHFDRSLMIRERKAILDRTLQGTARPGVAPSIDQTLVVPSDTGRTHGSIKAPTAIGKLLRHLGLLTERAALQSQPTKGQASSSPPAAEQPSSSSPPAGVEAPSSPSTTDVEAVLEKYGYVWWADVVRQRRKSAEHCVPGRMY